MDVRTDPVVRRTGRRRRVILAGMLALFCAGYAHAAVEVRIEGVEDEVRENVLGYLSIAQRNLENADERGVRRLHARAPAEIRQALQPFGYYQPAIDSELEPVGEGDWQATYRINPGERVRLARVDIEIAGDAADDPAFDAAVRAAPLAEGAPLNHADYEATKEQLMALAAERGYVEAKWVRSTLRIDLRTNTAAAVLELASGPRYRFGEITFHATDLDEDFLRRYLQFKTGDPFEASELLKLQYALSDTRYFQRVDVAAPRERAHAGRIPVVVELETRPQHLYSFGIGYGTDTGARISIGRSDRWVNARGHKLDIELQLAEIGTRLSARYTIPLRQPWRERLELVAGIGEREIGGGRTRQRQIGIRRITTHSGWQRTFALDYERSTDEIGGETTTRDLVMPGMTASHGEFNDPVYATRGYRVSAELRGGSKTLGSDVSFLRLRTGADFVRQIRPGGRILLRADLGRIWVDDLDDLPLSQRFFAGGDDSVRGFAYQSLAPINERGEEIGGRYLTVFSVEYEQIVANNWGAAVFVDTGNAMNDLDTDLQTAVGVGLRYRSPVGVFRIDIAQPIEGDRSPRLHLGLGVNL